MGERICSVLELETPCGAKVFCRDMCTKHWTRWRRYGDPLHTNRPMYRQPEDIRFFAKVDAGGVCWEWMATRDVDGYGKFDRTVAHVWIWRHLLGPIPDDHEIDHRCRNRGCVNPDHLECVPKLVNRARSFSPWAVHARATHCPKGHPYDGDNLYVVTRANGSTARQCRACSRARSRKAVSSRGASESP